MKTTKTRKYTWGKLALRADFSQANSSIQYSIDGEDFDVTPYQVADARHSVGDAFRLINRWLEAMV